MKIDMEIHGGPAYPNENWRQTRPDSYPFAGMSLRDFFAAKALANEYCDCTSCPADVARAAYQVADAMLDERAK